MIILVAMIRNCMLLFQYDFKIEFYDDVAFRDQRPKLVVETKNGVPVVNILISNEYSCVGSLQWKKAQIRLFNVPLNFSKSLGQGDIVRIYYKKFASDDDLGYKFIISGYLGAPVDFECQNGDFISQYEVYLLSQDTFFNKKLDIKDYTGKSLKDAINLACPGQAIIYMSEQDMESVIYQSFYASTLREFIERLIGKYVQLIFVDIGDLDYKVDTKFVFINFNGFSSNQNYNKLENFVPLSSPQREVRFVGKSTINFWDAILLFTDKIKVGDPFQFVDRYGNIVKTVVQRTSAELNNVGKCVLRLSLYDESNVL
ncbi:Hypothetical protein BCD_1311 (plasmid) [Borrelia crocidurae DOU]|uniref:Uncharacterized protein n=1 Tax=Borrelia crocidurae DOU TaxID=1293575 RepID=W5SKF4_9SPIR|nr:DUF693 family protein [Borrelia crocidurae]AHH07377.1 Hypothetical protein BCD_1311 [Borrelia crocidurae DOU]